MALSARRISSNKIGKLAFDLDGMHHEALASRALLTSRTELTLMATSTKNPADSSRICQTARRR